MCLIFDNDQQSPHQASHYRIEGISGILLIVVSLWYLYLHLSHIWTGVSSVGIILYMRHSQRYLDSQPQFWQGGGVMRGWEVEEVGEVWGGGGWVVVGVGEVECEGGGRWGVKRGESTNWIKTGEGGGWHRRRCMGKKKRNCFYFFKPWRESGVSGGKPKRVIF